jgi:hypothetical protein
MKILAVLMSSSAEGIPGANLAESLGCPFAEGNVPKGQWPLSEAVGRAVRVHKGLGLHTLRAGPRSPGIGMTEPLTGPRFGAASERDTLGRTSTKDFENCPGMEARG